MSDGVHISDRDGIRRIEIDRPTSRNGLTNEINGRMIEALGEARESGDIRVVILTGAGGNFCSGVDLRAGIQGGPRSEDELRQSIDTYFHGLIRALHGCGKPTIAAVDGVAVGFGCDLALACDIRLLSDRARIGEIFSRRGLIPDGGGTFTLPRLVGLARAFELIYTGEIVDARTALQIGLANHVYALDQFEDEGWEMATRLAKGPPIAYRLIKQAVWASLGGTLDQALEREREGQLECLQSRDFAEGVTAFFARREPEFVGK